MTHPFTIAVDPATLQDLRERLAKTRWPGQVENHDWSAGTNETYLQRLCAYWQHEFDWSRQEAYLNSFSQFKTTIDGQGIQFIHQKGNGRVNLPLLLTHGWPDSFVRFLKLIPLLTTADEKGLAFDVVVPSIPGFGFSDRPTEAGMNPTKIAGLFARLMTDELGYRQFIAHGGDWGGIITEHLALYHADDLLAIHLTDLPFQHTLAPPKDMSPAEQAFFDEKQRWRQTEGAYAQIQATKPQSLAYGLNDSPAGLAGWIIEKFYAWSDIEGDLTQTFSPDELLTNLTVYWVTQTAGSAARIYYEAMQAIMAATRNPLTKLNPFDKTNDKSTVKAGFALFPKDIGTAPKELVERFFTVAHWTELDKGGHFAAMEQPELLANAIRQFVRDAVEKPAD